MRLIFPLSAYTAFGGDDKTWYNLLTRDPIYLHITAFAAETFISQLTSRQNDDGKATHHLVKGVKLLRERLLLPDEQAKISEGTISVILTLAVIARSKGEYEVAKQHLEGLRKIVDLRGGLASLRGRGNFGLKMLMEMFRCDIGMALHTGSPTIFFRNKFQEPFIPYPALHLWPSRELSRTEDLPDTIDANLTRAWTTMQDFCSLVNLAAQTQRKLPPETLLDSMASVMYRLLHLGFRNGSIDEAIRLGLLALSRHIFLQWQGMDLPYTHLTCCFRDCLVDMMKAKTGPKRIVLWLSMIGGISMFDIGEEEWLRNELREQLEICRIKSWEEMRGILTGVMWIEKLHEKPARNVYEVVSAL